MRAVASAMGLALSLFIPVASAFAQGATSNTAYVVSYIEIAPELAPKAAALLREARGKARKESGNIGFLALQRRQASNHFALLEAWADRNAADAHAASADSRQLAATLEPMLIAPVDRRLHSVLFVDGRAAAAITDPRAGTVYLLTHVDMVPTGKDAGLAAIETLAVASRKESDNAAFAVLQQSSRANHLTVFEAWRSDKALLAHFISQHAKTYRAILAPISGALYDQRTYVALR